MVSRAKEEAATERIAELSRQRDGAAAEASAAAAALAAARAAHVEAVQDARRKVGEAAEAERDALTAKLQTAEAQRDDAREKSSASATELSIVRAQVLRPLTTLPLGVVPPPLSWALFARRGRLRQRRWSGCRATWTPPRRRSTRGAISRSNL